jgi:HAD superfamily hydrolase (TIGR01490 family)
MSKKPSLVIFDLDYTLTRRGTWGRFVWMNVKSRPHIWLPLLFKAGWSQWRYKRGKIARIKVKEAMMRRTMVGMSRTELRVRAEKFAEAEVPHRLKPGAIKALDIHRANGDIIIIASAAVDIIVRPIAARLGINHFVATDMAWDDRGRLKPSFASENCYGAAKLSRVKDLISNHTELAKPNHTIAYSDSIADLPLLEFSHTGVAVDPKEKFVRAISKRPNIHVERWV